MSGGDLNKGEPSNSIDFSSPYYLHPSDFPKQLHVNEILTDGNYTDWAQEMSNFLFAKNKIDFVDGTLKKPEITSQEYKPWMRCDAMVKGWLATSMEKNIRDSVKYATTASEIWSDLRERFGKENAPRAYELKQKIAATRQNGNNVSTYYTRLRALWDESQSIFSFPCCSCGKCTCELGKKITDHLEKERLYEFLMGLDSDFNVIKTQILATKPVPTLGTAYHMVADDERHRMISNENRATPESAAFKTFQKRENYYGQTKERSVFKQGKENKQNDECTGCGKTGHKLEGCFKEIGYPDWWPGKKDNKIKNLGQLKYFLGIEVAKTSDGLVLSQRKYTLDILKDSGMLGCRPSAFPFEQGIKLDKGEEEARVDAAEYRRLVGRLLYLQATRPDITYAVNVLSQFVTDPRRNHSEAANRVLRYLKGTPGQGILLPREGPPILTAYCDSDWLGCPFTRRSRTGYLLLLGGGPISWKTKKQSVVSRSSAEAEYRSMASTVSEILWVRWLLKDMQVHITEPTSLFCDNQAARHIANNPVYHERTKHVEMDCFFVRERVDTKEIIPEAIDSKLQLADLLTKGLGTPQLHFLLNKMGIKDLHAPS